MFKFLKNKGSKINKNIVYVKNVNHLTKIFRFDKGFKIIEKDLDIENNDTEKYGRKRIDAEVLSTIAANAQAGKMLDIGTHRGRSAVRIAINSPKSTIYTVNIHPEDKSYSGKLVTDILSEAEIGSYYKKHNITNIKQIFANTKNWKIPESINNLSLVFVDGCHDQEFVYSDSLLALDRLVDGGFLLWHDFNPHLRHKFKWIDESMSAVEKLIVNNYVKDKIYHVMNSWIGIWQKND